MADDARRFDSLERVVRETRLQFDDARALLANRVATHTHAGGGGGAGVASVSAGDATITIAGTTATPTVAVGTVPQARVTSLTADLAARALDAAVVHSAGAETIGGVKTFSAAPVVPTAAFPEAAVVNLVSDLAGKVASTRLVTAGTGLAGGGNLTADRTLSVAYGNATGTAVQGNDARVLQGAAAGYPISAYGYVACSIHPDCVANVATAVTVNTAEVYRIWVPAGQALTGAACYVGTAGVTPGATNASGFALYDDVGAQLASTTADYALFTTIGLRTKAFTAVVAASGVDRFVRLMMVHTCTTAPRFAVGPGNTSGFDNVSVSGAAHRRGVFLAGVTAYPASFAAASYGGLDAPMLFLALY